MKLRTAASVAGLAVAVLSLATLRPGAGAAKKGQLAPPFPSERPSDWIGEPLSMAALRGRVVLLDVWTFG